MGASRATQPRSLQSFKPALGCNSGTVEASRQVALGQTGGRLTGPLRWSKRGKNLGVLVLPRSGSLSFSLRLSPSLLSVSAGSGIGREVKATYAWREDSCGVP